MLENPRKEEQQRKASDRYYSRQKAAKVERLGERLRSEIINPLTEAQPIEKRVIFLKPGDGLAQERIIGKSDLVDISYLELGLLVARPV
jgi:endonuclease G